MNIIRNIRTQARHFKLATLLNFLGLTVALTALYLFLTQIAYNHYFNRSLTDHRHLFRLEVRAIMDQTKWMAQVSRLFVDNIALLPQIEDAGIYRSEGQTNLSHDGGDISANFIGCSDRYLATLAPRCLSGTLSWTEGQKNGIIIAQSVAQAYFGETDVAGRMVAIKHRKDSVEVRGVYEDFADNTMVRNGVYENIGKENLGNWNNFNYGAFVRIRADVDTTDLSRTLSKSMLGLVKETLMAQGMPQEEWDKAIGEGFDIGLRFMPVAQTYFSGVDPQTDRGNRSMDLVLRLACVLIVIIVTINFLNFTLATSVTRIRSVVTRRILGSSVAVLRLSLVAEAVVTTVAAWFVSLGIVYLLSRYPFTHELLVGSIRLGDHVGLLLITLALAVVIAIAAGTYPALYVTGFKPAMALSGTFGLTPRGQRLRTALVALQFVIASIMTVYIGILFSQSRYIYHSDYGFAKDEILYAGISSSGERREAIRNEVMAIGGVEEVGFSQFMIGTSDTYMSWSRSGGDRYARYFCMPCDWRYPKVLGVDIIEGRTFSEHDNNTYIINRAMREAYDWIEMDKPLLEENETADGVVVGVCENMRFGSVRVDRATTNMALYIMGPYYADWGDPLHVINVRVGAGVDKHKVRNTVQAVLDSMEPDVSHDVCYLDQDLQELYTDEFRFIRQVSVFAIINILITLIGVFCLVLFETAFRRREIGIRKVMGATSGDVLRQLLRRYVLLVTLSFVVAAPVAAYFGHEWLQNFAERTEIHWWLFPVTLLLIGCVTILTVWLQAWRAASENPIEAIKVQ